jgi:hypothetical protein
VPPTRPHCSRDVPDGDGISTGDASAGAGRRLCQQADARHGEHRSAARTSVLSAVMSAPEGIDDPSSPRPSLLNLARLLLWTHITLTMLAAGLTVAALLVPGTPFLVLSPIFVVGPVLLITGITGLRSTARNSRWERLLAGVGLLTPASLVGVSALEPQSPTDVNRSASGAHFLSSQQQSIETALAMMTWAHGMVFAATWLAAGAALLIFKARDHPGSTKLGGAGRRMVRRW